jgi:tellurite resistance protein
MGYRAAWVSAPKRVRIAIEFRPLYDGEPRVSKDRETDLNRIGTTLLMAAVIVAVALSALAYQYVSDAERAQALTAARILDMMSAELRTQTPLRSELTQQLLENGASAQGDYLAAIRRDGMQAHKTTKQKLDALSKSNVAILTLLDLYEPYAQTDGFKAETRAFRSYAIAWNDRWDSVMEYFMAGGNVPASDVPFPDGFRAAVEAEKELAAN